MESFTFEFLPHYAGGVMRKADFSLYEINWNIKGRWGFFECQINIPTNVKFIREKVTTNSRHILANDISVSDNYGNWDAKRLALFHRFNGKILTSLPNDIHFYPQEHFLLRLILTFNKEERLAIAKALNFQYKNNNDKLIETFHNDVSIGATLQKYSGHFVIE